MGFHFCLHARPAKTFWWLFVFWLCLSTLKLYVEIFNCLFFSLYKFAKFLQYSSSFYRIVTIGYLDILIAMLLVASKWYFGHLNTVVDIDVCPTVFISFILSRWHLSVWKTSLVSFNFQRFGLFLCIVSSLTVDTVYMSIHWCDFYRFLVFLLFIPNTIYLFPTLFSYLFYHFFLLYGIVFMYGEDNLAVIWV